MATFGPNEIFRRWEGNPIITPKMWPYNANAVFNPGAVEVDGETMLLVRVEDLQGFSHLTVAKSKDGKTDWRVEPQCSLMPDPAYNEEQWGVEDPRIVWLEEFKKYAITYVSFSKSGPVISLAMTEDFCSFSRLGTLMPPEDKDAALFPRRFGGRFALIHRPVIRGEADIWISFSPDLKFWGKHRELLPVRPGRWDCHRVGLGPPPIETLEGWLVIYHGVRITASGSLYRVGLALFDLEEPWKIIYRANPWVFGPQEKYEFYGDVPGVTFPTGAILDQNTGELRLYYGIADKVVGLAIGNLDQILDFLKNSPNRQIQ